MDWFPFFFFSSEKVRPAYMLTWPSRIRIARGVFAKPFDSREMNFIFIQNLLRRLLTPGLFCAHNFALSP